jgi:hypothetical protein
MRLSAIILILILMIQTAYASDESVWIGPQNALHPFKIWIEKFSLNFVFNQTEKTMRMVDLADERLKEAKEVENNSLVFEKTMNEYANQLMEIEKITKMNYTNKSDNININIIKKIEDQRNRVKSFNGAENIAIIQQNIIEASSSSQGNSIRVTAINGNISIYSDDKNATIKRDGNNISVISVTNNSRQVVIVKSSHNGSSSSSIIVQSNTNGISVNHD